MAKIHLSDDLKKKIAELTGLTYLAANLEKFDDTNDAEYVDSLLNYYAPQRKQLEDVNLIIKKDIMKEIPSLKLTVVVPGEGGLVESEDGDEETPEPVPSPVTLTIVVVPEDAKVTINGEETSGIEVESGTTVSYKVEKEGYKTVEDSIKVTENKVLEITLEKVVEPEPVQPTVTSDIPASIQVNTDVEYNVTTNPGDFAGVMVYGTAQVNIEAEKINKLEYWEPNEEVPSWHELPKNESGLYYFGVPSTGFPLAATSSKFRMNINTAGNYSVVTKIMRVDTQAVMCETTSEINVVEAVQLTSAKSRKSK